MADEALPAEVEMRMARMEARVHMAESRIREQASALFTLNSVLRETSSKLEEIDWTAYRDSGYSAFPTVIRTLQAGPSLYGGFDIAISNLNAVRLYQGCVWDGETALSGTWPSTDTTVAEATYFSIVCDSTAKTYSLNTSTSGFPSNTSTQTVYRLAYVAWASEQIDVANSRQYLFGDIHIGGGEDEYQMKWYSSTGSLLETTEEGGPTSEDGAAGLAYGAFWYLHHVDRDAENSKVTFHMYQRCLPTGVE